MTKQSSSSSKRNDVISVGDMMFQIITKNTEVMTALCETLKDIEETIDDITKSDVRSKYAREDILDIIQDVKKLAIAILVGIISIIVMFAMGGKVGWLVELGTKIIGMF